MSIKLLLISTYRCTCQTNVWLSTCQPVKHDNAFVLRIVLVGTYRYIYQMYWWLPPHHPNALLGCEVHVKSLELPVGIPAFCSTASCMIQQSFWLNICSSFSGHWFQCMSIVITYDSQSWASCGYACLLMLSRLRYPHTRASSYQLCLVCALSTLSWHISPCLYRYEICLCLCFRLVCFHCLDPSELMHWSLFV